MLRSALPLALLLAAIVVLAATGNLLSPSPLVIAVQGFAVALTIAARRTFTAGTFRVVAAPVRSCSEVRTGSSDIRCTRRR